MPGGMSQACYQGQPRARPELIIPLVDFTLDNGATQLLPGSHERNWRRVAETGGPSSSHAWAPLRLRPGTYHRGLVTSHGGATAIILLRPESYAPPGVGTYGSMAHSLRGRAPEYRLHLLAPAPGRNTGFLRPVGLRLRLTAFAAAVVVQRMVSSANASRRGRPLAAAADARCEQLT